MNIFTTVTAEWKIRHSASSFTKDRRGDAASYVFKLLHTIRSFKNF